MNPAVAYCRCSTDKQETSIAEQIAAIKRYADEKGYRIADADWYADEGISGDATAKRTDFLRMLRDVQQRHDIRAILVWDQDRFGRFSSHEASFWTWPLAQAGVQLVTVNKGPIDWNDFVQWLTYSVTQHGKHEFLKDHARNVTRGQLACANSGSWLGAHPYAYRIEGEKHHKRLVIDDPGQVRIVQRIFKEYVEQGRSLCNIAARLNKDGVVSPGGRIKGWRYDVIRSILENPAYTGDTASLKNSFGKYHTNRNGSIVKGGKRCRKPESEWVVKLDTHEAIIDRTTFEKAKEILSKGKKGRTTYEPEDNPYLLSGLLRCGKCGSGLVGLNTGSHRYYECSNMVYNGKESCCGTTVREDRVLTAVADYLQAEYFAADGDYLEDQAIIGELTEQDFPQTSEAFTKIRAIIAPPARPKGERQRQERQLKELTAKLAKARGNVAFLNVENIPAAQEAIKKVEEERTALELELRKKPPSEQDINAEVLSVLRCLSVMKAALVNAAEQRGAGSDKPLPMARWALKPVSGIIVHTRIKEGRGKIRHEFLGGEVALRRMGTVTVRDESSSVPHCRRHEHVRNLRFLAGAAAARGDRAASARGDAARTSGPQSR
jgi:site-specific DNA recombinase